MKLMLLEMKRCLKNPFFWIVSIMLFVFINSQFSGDISNWIIPKPIPKQENYGSTATEDMNVVRSNALLRLLGEYSNNSYSTYPYGFYRSIELNDRKNEEITKLLSALTGASIQDIKSIQTSNIKDTNFEDNQIIINEKFENIIDLSKTNIITDKDYLNLMENVDQLLGGGSSYSKKLVVSKFGSRSKTYEEAILEYNDMINKDKITGSFARLFCDYAGIGLALLPIFLVVAFWYQDKKDDCSNILYSKKSSSIKIVLSRYLAMLILFTLVILLIATFYNTKIIKANGIGSVDLLAYYKYALLWLVPSLMVVLSVGTFTTILTNSPIGILVMLGWWYITMFGSEANIQGGGYGYQLVLRHNIIGNTKVYFENLHLIFLNRAIYVIISIILILLSIKIYNKKREGKISR